MKEAEAVMDKLCEYLDETTLELLLAVEEELYEYAADIRDDISTKIDKVTDTLINREWSKLNEDEIKIQMYILRDGYLKKWYETMCIPRERTIYNI
jgi:uncharacterized protein (UPF0216 family)